jgi:hypothetical protein
MRLCEIFRDHSSSGLPALPSMFLFRPIDPTTFIMGRHISELEAQQNESRPNVDFRQLDSFWISSQQESQLSKHVGHQTCR